MASNTQVTYVQRPAEDLLRDRWAPTFPITALDREWLARHNAGQTPEIWEINGGADSDIHGVTVLWVPEERVVHVANSGVLPRWYFSPFTRDTTLTKLARWDWHGFTRLEGYLPPGATCEDCHAVLSSEERDALVPTFLEFPECVWQCQSCISMNV